MSVFTTKVVESFNGFHQVELSIDHQTFLFEEKEGYKGEMTSREHAEWYKKNLDIALNRLLNASSTPSDLTNDQT